MAHLRHPLASAILAVLFLSGAAFAQVPKVGSTPYKDNADLGFRIKVPDDWELIPPTPDETNLIAKYDPPTTKYMQIGMDAANKPVLLWLHCWLIKFDRRPAPEGAKEPKFRQKPAKDLAAWLKENVDNGGALKVESEKAFTVEKIEAKEILYTTPGDPKIATRYYACVYKLKPDVDVAIVFSAPGDPKKWNKWEGPLTTMGKSLALEAKKDVAGGTALGTTLRDKTRAELNMKLATQPGWKLHETANYFIVTPHQDKAFVEELKKRLEAIRLIYEHDYPAAKADEYKKIGLANRTGTPTKEEQAEAELAKEIFGDADPREMSKCSVVRVLTDDDAYYSYGGRPGTAGYWNWVARELVVFDDQASGGRNDTWNTLNHEAFHQYIFYFYGNISPHSWYNEGTGDFYSGYFWKNGQFILKENSWRNRLISENIRKERFAPLDVFVRWSQQEYYGSNELSLNGFDNYAQGWSVIWFLRTGKKNNAEGWNPAWDSILDTYLRVLATSSKLEQAVDEAFKGVDMKALEAAWIAYTK